MKKILYLLLFILIPLALAIENFNVYSKQLIDTCDCSQYIHEIKIHNIGNKADFILYSKGINAKWIQPIQFTLNKNELRKINLPINIPCTIRGQYSLDLYVKTPTLTKKIPLTINVRRCPNIEVKADNYQEACPGQQVKYPIEIKNTGNFKEIYSFNLDNYKQYALINYRALEIEPGKTAKFNLYLNIPLTFEDEYNFTFITKTKYSKLTASTPLFFNALPCYKYTLDYEDNYTLCQGIEENLLINIENLGDDQIIFFKLIEPKWASLSKNNIELKKDEQDIVNIKVKPDRTGKYDLILKSKNDIKEKEDLIVLDVKSKRDCYKAEITAPKVGFNQKGSFKIKNIGFKEATYSLSIDSDWITTPDSITLAPNKEKEIDLDIDWKEGRYNFNIKAEVEEEQFVQSITMGEVVFHKKIGNFFVNLYNKTKDFVVKNIRYVAIIFGVIILLIIILKVISKISEKKLEKELLEEPKVELKEKPKKAKAEVKVEKKVKEKPKKKKKEKRKKPKKPFKFPKINWKIIIPIIIIIVIALLFYFIEMLRNYFLAYWLYLIIGIIILFLFIFFITLMSKIEIKKKRKTIKWLITIFVIILILLFIYLQYPSIFKFDFDFSKIKNKITDIWDSIKGIFMPVYDFLYAYINYIILGFVVLIILIFFMNLLEKRKKEKKEVKEEKEEKKENKKTKKISKRKKKK